MSNPRRTVRNWSELDSDLLSEIADRINCLRDFIIFGAVCRSWRSVASPENFNKTTKAPWLLLDQDKDDHSSRKFLDLSNDIIYRMNLPKYDYTQFDLWKYSVRSSIREKHYVYSSKGWFLNVENHLRLSLLNPFSLSTIDLPHLESKVLLNFALSSSPSAASDFMILIAYYASAMRDIKLSFWKNGDRKWTDLDLKFCISDLNITYHNGRFYIVDGVEFGETFVVHEIDIQNPQSVLISSKSFPDSYPSTRIHYPFWIVESSRVLMKVSWRLNYVSSDVRAIITDDFYSHVPHFQFIVEEINFEKGECKKVSDLGDEALSLGYYSSFLVDVSNELRFKSNRIYFAENFQHPFLYESSGSVGVYSMMDGSYEPFFTDADSGYRCSSQWIEPRP